MRDERGTGIHLAARSPALLKAMLTAAVLRAVKREEKPKLAKTDGFSGAMASFGDQAKSGHVEIGEAVFQRSVFAKTRGSQCGLVLGPFRECWIRCGPKKRTPFGINSCSTRTPEWRRREKDSVMPQPVKRGLCMK